MTYKSKFKSNQNQFQLEFLVQLTFLHDKKISTKICIAIIYHLYGYYSDSDRLSNGKPNLNIFQRRVAMSIYSPICNLIAYTSMILRSIQRKYTQKCISFYLPPSLPVFVSHIFPNH